jgi:hypothetical protein
MCGAECLLCFEPIKIRTLTCYRRCRPIKFTHISLIYICDFCKIKCTKIQTVCSEQGYYFALQTILEEILNIRTQNIKSKQEVPEIVDDSDKILIELTLPKTIKSSRIEDDIGNDCSGTQ